VGGYLHQRGYTIAGPLLPGHGTSVDDMNRCKWTDWTSYVEKSLADLQARCETVFVGGLSMGSVLTLYLAVQHPELDGIITCSPAVWPANRLIYLTPVFKYIISKRPKSEESDLTDPEADLRLWSYEEDPIFAAHELLKLIRRVRRLLPQVTCPLLVIHSTLDQDIHPKSALFTYERVGSADKELVTLRNSGHCITVDSEWKFVAEKTYEFIQAHQ
jgi:carboxylesterase